jgi:glycosyltransferase involved in cell wall biosynthesis
MPTSAGPSPNSDKPSPKTRVLVVCTWPLGGIRTFLKYNYRHFDRDKFDITILAIPTIEKKSFEDDFISEHIPVIWSEPWLGRNILFARVHRLLRSSQFDCIHSQGFTAAFHVALANWFFRRPHVLTMHGILEPKYFQGWSGPFKRFIFRRVLANVTVFHAVGQDMLDHFKREIPQLASGASRAVVIRNGIDTARFAQPDSTARTALRKLLACPDDTFVFGYFGRFMPEKGFDLLIKASETLNRERDRIPPFRVLAMGSGDYESSAKNTVHSTGLEEIIRFHPFDPEVDRFIKGCDAVVVPSRHEAFPLLPCEALTAGIPVIASDAMGLREAVRDTPALVFPAGDPDALANIMRSLLLDRTISERFLSFRTIAAERFDVRITAARLAELLADVTRERSVPCSGDKHLPNDQI